MARTYNEQAPDGSWRQVTQNDDGTYSTQPIAPSNYGAANIPGGSSTGGGSSPPPGQATQAQMVAALQGAGYNGPWDDQSVSDAYARTYNGGNAGAGSATGGNTAVNIAAANLAAQTAYQTALIAGMSDRLAFDKATEAWNETFKQKQADTQQGNTVVDQQFRQGQANNTNALNLLGLQSKLSGPANAFEYAKLLTGTPGGLADIVRAAGGAYQLPQFGGGAPGNPTPLSIQTMIDDLNRYAPSGGGQAPVTAAPSPTIAPPTATGAPGTYQTVNGTKTVEQMAHELKVAGWGGNTSDAAAVAAAYGSTTKGAVTPNAVSAAPPTTAPTATPPANPGAGAQSTQIPDSLATLAPPTSQYIPQYGDVPRGNQIAPQNWSNMDPSQQALLLDTMKQPGWLPEDIMAQFQKSLRGYGGPVSGAVGF